MSKLSIVIPTYNNQNSITQVIKEAMKLEPYEILVCNDGSRDKTAQILSNLKQISVITHPQNMGYGQTIKELYYTARGEWIFSLPGDGQVPASALIVLLPYMEQADMIIGWRSNRQDPPNRLRQSRIYNFLLRILFNLNFHDVNSVRLMKREILDKIKLKSTSAYVDAELTIRAKRVGYRICEVPIEHKADTHPGSGGKLWTILTTIVDMIRFLWQ